MKISKVFIFYLICWFFYTHTALAARIGGGRSFGMQRNTFKSRPINAPKPAYSSPSSQPGNTMSNQQNRRGIGAGTAAMMGAAAGAATGYMLGKNSAENKGSESSINSTIAEKTENNIPWGIITILGILLVMGLLFFRKKTHPGLSGHNSQTNSYNQPQSPKFNIPGINKGTGAESSSSKTSQPNTLQGATNQEEKMPDGIESIYFLRQAKGMFLHIQSMNNPENINEVAKYMTADLFNEVKDEISSNKHIADFNNLDCQLLNSEKKDDQIVASVKFFGMVSEEPQKPHQPFSEVWNFIKSDLTNNKWLVAGIQQEKLA